MSKQTETQITTRTTWTGSITVEFSMTVDPTWYPKSDRPTEEHMIAYIKQQLINRLEDEGAVYKYEANAETFKISKEDQP
jgi:hypothetical protein